MLSKNQIKEIQSLQLKKFREEKKLFIAEGIKTVTEILETSPNILKQLFANADFIQLNNSLISRAKVSLTEVTDEELKKISLQSTPNSVFAICHFFEEENTDLDLTKYFSMYLDDVRDPGNFGTIIRLADWFGVKTIFVSPDTCEFYNPKVIQSTMGAFLRVKVQTIKLHELKEKFKIKKIYGAVLTGKNLYKEKLEPGLIVIGNEANGISDANLKLISDPITIPSNSQNGTESLNAAVAASVITSEFFRQLTQ